MSQTTARDLSARFESHVARAAGRCHLWQSAKFRGGYGMFWCDKRMRSAHRVAFELAHGAIPAGMHVCHRCDVRHCVNPDHLFLGNNAENVADKVAKGRQAAMKGEAHPGRKLSDAEVLSIRDDLRSSRVIAKAYGVSKKAVLNIRHRRSWSHL